MSDTFVCGGCQTEISYQLPDFSDHYFNLCSGEILHQCQIADCNRLFAGREDLYRHGIENHLGTIFYEETYVVLNEEEADVFCRENLITPAEGPRKIDPKFYCDDFENLIDNLAEKPRKNSKSVRYKMNVICKMCGKKISHTSMEKHFKSCRKDGTREKIHQCSYEGCNSTFTTKDHRHRHEVSVHCSPVKCPYENCIKLVKPAGLNFHIKRVHLNRNSTEDNKAQISLGEYDEIKPSVESTEQMIPKTTANGYNDEVKLKLEADHKIIFQNEVDEINQKITYEDTVDEFKEAIEMDQENSLKNEEFRSPPPKKFVCPNENCAVIFDKRQQWAKHMNDVHQAPVYCPYEDCCSLVKLANLARHIRGTHEKIRKQCASCQKWLSIYCIRAHQKHCHGAADTNAEIPTEFTTAKKKRSKKKIPQTIDEQISHLRVDDQSGVDANSTSATVKNDFNPPKIENGSLPQNLGQNTASPSKCTIKVETQSKVHDSSSRGENSVVIEETFPCSFEGCGAIYETIEGRYEHYNIVHLKRVKCTYANCNAFVKQTCLSAHIKARHEKIKKQCTNCQKWTSIYSFYAHYERCTSNGEKKYACTYEGCDATFTTSANRFSHVSITHRKFKGPQDAGIDDKQSNVP